VDPDGDHDGMDWDVLPNEGYQGLEQYMEWKYGKQWEVGKSNL
jgi:hypothetical protein